jgi:hypothetical protein
MKYLAMGLIKFYQNYISRFTPPSCRFYPTCSQYTFEAIEKWFAIVVLAINYLQYRMALAYSMAPSKVPLADFVRQHRLEHFKNLLRSVLEPFAKPHQIETCLKEVFTASPQAVI